MKQITTQFTIITDMSIGDIESILMEKFPNIGTINFNSQTVPTFPSMQGMYHGMYSDPYSMKPIWNAPDFSCNQESSDSPSAEDVINKIDTISNELENKYMVKRDKFSSSLEDDGNINISVNGVNIE